MFMLSLLCFLSWNMWCAVQEQDRFVVEDGVTEENSRWGLPWEEDWYNALVNTLRLASVGAGAAWEWEFMQGGGDNI